MGSSFAQPKRKRYSTRDRELFFEVMEGLGSVAAASAALGMPKSVCYRWAAEPRESHAAQRKRPGGGTAAAARASPKWKGWKYSGQDRERFFAAMESADSVLAASVEVGIPKSVCYRWVAEHGRIGSRRNRTAELKEKVLAAVQAGWRGADAARHFGVLPSKVYRWVHAAGLSRPRQQGPSPREEYLKLRARGLSRREAAAAVGVHPKTASDYDLGIRRSHGRRVYPDGRVSGTYKRWVENQPQPGISALDKAIDARYLSLPERETIRDLRATGASIRSIASALGRSPSTVSRELTRNAHSVRGYEPYAAHRKAAVRRLRPKKPKLVKCERLREYVQARLDLRFSPEQIGRVLEKKFPDDAEMRVSHETIYASIYRHDGTGLRRDPAVALRTGRTRRRPRRTGQERRRRFTDPMVMITDRPAEIEERAAPGHWEGDLITGSNNQSAIGTLVERTTRYVMLLHLPAGHSSEHVRAALVSAFEKLSPQLRGSLTWDQGAEMAGHASFTSTTGMPVYFCEPASPWQRGSNENTNGLLRQYFPKSTDLSMHGLEDLERVAAELNARPRKTLGWDSPAERLAGVGAAPRSATEDGARWCRDETEMRWQGSPPQGAPPPLSGTA